ncbi:MAG: YkgJ family cysteine cluster protein [Thermoguttaceae bacterium]|nr:YkgJ family cysteine cluster protein [Thermoguttaceae bacterium]
MDRESICVRCARQGKTCCQKCEIYVTIGDVGRIHDHIGKEGFYEFRVPDDPAYLDQKDDPLWQESVFQPDGSRRVLRRLANGDCTFLGPCGCVLPLEVRPLVCRLYPYEYNQEGILAELSQNCPTHLLQIGQSLIEALDMNLEQASRWHGQLYRELQREKQLTCVSV